MNREKQDQLPLMQVGFIDSICLPIYEVSTCVYCPFFFLLKALFVAVVRVVIR